MKWWEMIINKLFSARFIVTVFIGITYCKMVHHCVYFYLASMKNDAGKMEAFVTGLIMGFSSLAMYVIKSYFDRVDRPEAPVLLKTEEKLKQEPLKAPAAAPASSTVAS